MSSNSSLPPYELPPLTFAYREAAYICKPGGVNLHIRGGGNAHSGSKFDVDHNEVGLMSIGFGIKEVI